MFGVHARVSEGRDAEGNVSEAIKNNGGEAEGRRLLLGIYKPLTQCNVYSRAEKSGSDRKTDFEVIKSALFLPDRLCKLSRRNISIPICTKK